MRFMCSMFFNVKCMTNNKAHRGNSRLSVSSAITIDYSSIYTVVLTTTCFILLQSSSALSKFPKKQNRTKTTNGTSTKDGDCNRTRQPQEETQNGQRRSRCQWILSLPSTLRISKSRCARGLWISTTSTTTSYSLRGRSRPRPRSQLSTWSPASSIVRFVIGPWIRTRARTRSRP